MPRFENKIVLFGFGAVGQSVLRVLEKEIELDSAQLTIIDRKPQPFALKYSYVQAELNPLQQDDLFSPYLKSGDMLLDFTSETDCLETIKWCHKKGIMYLNTGDNEWPDKDWKNIYDHYKENEAFFKTCKKDSATCIIHHGANPGSVSHFAKKAIYDIVSDLVTDPKSKLDSSRLKELLSTKKWGELAEYIGVRTIHSSDFDSQEFDCSHLQEGAFYSTWNPPTFFNESTSLAEIRPGSFELNNIHSAAHLNDNSLGWQELTLRGTECYARDWTPAGEFAGMIIGHEEIFSISDCFSVYNPDGSLHYRPTVYFVYRASTAAMNSLHKQARENYAEPQKYQLIKDGIADGTEYVGVLVMGDNFKSRWVGNCITLDFIKKNFPALTPTILQVAVPAVAAISYMIEHPNLGICYPDDLPYEPILATIEKHLGATISVTTDFSVSHDITKDIMPLT